MIAHSLSPNEIRKLRREFNKVDIEGRGVIRPQDLQKAFNASGNYSPEEMTRMFGHMDVDHDGTIGARRTKRKDYTIDLLAFSAGVWGEGAGGDEFHILQRGFLSGWGVIIPVWNSLFIVY